MKRLFQVVAIEGKEQIRRAGYRQSADMNVVGVPRHRREVEILRDRGDVDAPVREFATHVANPGLGNFSREALALDQRGLGLAEQLLAPAQVEEPGTAGKPAHQLVQDP